jgi:hypothetical protein
MAASGQGLSEPASEAAREKRDIDADTQSRIELGSHWAG